MSPLLESYAAEKLLVGENIQVGNVSLFGFLEWHEIQKNRTNLFTRLNSKMRISNEIKWREGGKEKVI